MNPFLFAAGLLLLAMPSVVALFVSEPDSATPPWVGPFLVVGDDGPSDLIRPPEGQNTIEERVWAHGSVRYIPDWHARNRHSEGVALKWARLERVECDLTVMRVLSEQPSSTGQLDRLFSLLDDELAPDGWSGRFRPGAMHIERGYWLPWRIAIDVTRGAGIAILGLCVILGIWREVRRGKRIERIGAGQCPECAYDRDQLPLDRPCPECGHKP